MTRDLDTEASLLANAYGIDLTVRDDRGPGLAAYVGTAGDMGWLPALFATFPDLEALAVTASQPTPWRTRATLWRTRHAMDLARAFAACGAVAGLRVLEIGGLSGFRPPTAAELLSAPLRSLEKLVVSGCAIGIEGARVIASSAAFGRLRSLDLADAAIGTAAFKALAASPHLGELVELSVSLGPVGDAGAKALAASPTLRKLRALCLRGTEIGGEGAKALAASANLASVERLCLSANGIGPQGGAALAASPHLERLVHLDVWGNSIGDEGARALLSSDRLPLLEELDLGGNALGPGALEPSAAPPPRLSSLDLGSNQLGPDGAAALARSRLLAGLTRLGLDGNANVGDAGAIAIAGSPHAERLVELTIAQSLVTGGGAKTLAASPHLGRLRKLSLMGSDVDDEGATALAHSDRLPALEELDLGSCHRISAVCYQDVSAARARSLAPAPPTRVTPRGTTEPTP